MNMKLTFNDRTWDVFPFTHTPNTPIQGYTQDNEYEEDWKVMDTDKGVLWMNNASGYMYIIGRDGKTYVTYF